MSDDIRYVRIDIGYLAKRSDYILAHRVAKYNTKYLRNNFRSFPRILKRLPHLFGQPVKRGRMEDTRRHENSRARRNSTKKSIAIDRAPIGIADEWYLWRATRAKILTYFARDECTRDGRCR